MSKFDSIFPEGVTEKLWNLHLQYCCQNKHQESDQQCYEDNLKQHQVNIPDNLHYHQNNRLEEDNLYIEKCHQ